MKAVEVMGMLLNIKLKCQDADRLWQVEELVSEYLDRVEVAVALEGDSPLDDILEILSRNKPKDEE